MLGIQDQQWCHWTFKWTDCAKSASCAVKSRDVHAVCSVAGGGTVAGALFPLHKERMRMFPETRVLCSGRGKKIDRKPAQGRGKQCGGSEKCWSSCLDSLWF